MLGLTTALTGDRPYYNAFNEFSLLLDGSNDYVSAIVATATYRGSFTVSFVIKADDGHPSSEQTFFGLNNRTDEDHFYINLTTDGSIKVYHKSNNDPATTITDEAVFSDGAQEGWTRITVTVTRDAESGTAYEIYRNSTLLDTTTTESVSDANHASFDRASDPTGIGARANGTTGTFDNNFGGYIDEVGVWDVSLPANSISDMHNSFIAFDFANKVVDNYEQGSELVNFYRFEEGAGTTVVDSSANTNNGTISGAIFVSDVANRGDGSG